MQAADTGAQAQAGWLGLGPAVSTDGSYDGGGIYTAFEDGQSHPASAPSVPIVKEARKRGAQADQEDPNPNPNPNPNPHPHPKP